MIVGQHASDFNLNPKNKADRSEFKNIISNIVDKNDEVRTGIWRDGKEVMYYLKNDDVVVVEKNNKNFVTILKGGVNSDRIKNARERK